MTTTTPQNYWLSPTTLNISLNALNSPNYIQAYVSSQAQILVYVKGIIDYDDAHNYRHWQLEASSTVFGTNSTKYVYAAVPRNNGSKPAVIVFPSELIDIYGKNEQGTALGSYDYYYIFLQGVISPSADTENTTTLRNREFSSLVNCGTLSTDEAYDAEPTVTSWYQLISTGDYVLFLKKLANEASSFFVNLYAKTINIVTGGSINFADGGSITGVTTTDTPITSTDRIVTPKYLDEKSLSKSHNDKTDFNLEMKNLKANGTADIFGNVVAHADLAVLGNITIGTFNKGISGGLIDSNADAELKSLTLRESLTVPKLVYNRVEVMAGNTWRSPGGGEILTVTPDEDNNTTGTIALRLEYGEVGMVAVGDICQGVFHITDPDSETSPNLNDTVTSDTRNGNFHFAGFKTIYFEITEIIDTDYNSTFKYKLRSATDSTWTDSTHPQPHMNFAVYGNRINALRQSSALNTTQYHLLLAGVTSWTYNSNNIQYVEGLLTGFNIGSRYYDTDSHQWIETAKQLTGYGVAFGKAYMWGTIDQFDRKPSLVSQQIYYLVTNSTKTPDTNDPDWSTTPQTPDKDNRYLWQYYLQTFSDDSTKVEEPFLAFRYATDGTSVRILSSFATLDALKAAYNAGSLTPGIGNGYIINSNGHLYVFSVDTYSNPKDFDSDMNDVGQIKGDQGIPGIQGVQGDPTVVYMLSPADAYVKVDADGNYSVESLFCFVDKYEGNDISSHVQYGKIMVVIDEIDNDILYDDGDALLYDDNSEIEGVQWYEYNVTMGFPLGLDYKPKKCIKFVLYSPEGKLLNVCNVPVVTDGDDALNIYTENETVFFAKKGDIVNVYIEVFKKGERLVYDNGYGNTWVASSFPTKNILDDKVRWTFVIDNDYSRFYYRFACLADDPATLDGLTLDYHIIHNGVKYPRTVTFRYLPQGKQGDQGPRGYTGVTVRRSEWEEGVSYRNDSEDGSVDAYGNRYLDEVSITDAATGSAQWFVARPAHNGVLSTADNKPASAGNDQWEPMNDMRPIRTSFADIYSAFIKFLQVSQIQIVDDNNQPYGAFGGGNTEYPLWFGGQTPTNAVMRVNKQGHLYSNKFITEGDTAHVEIDRGIMSVFGTGETPNIRFGIDASGNATMSYYNADGSLLYDLGPNGLRYTESRAASMRQIKGIMLDASIFSGDTDSVIRSLQEYCDGLRNKSLNLNTDIDVFIYSSPINAGVLTYPDENNCAYNSDNLNGNAPAGRLFTGRCITISPLKEFISSDGLYPPVQGDSDMNQVNVTASEIASNEMVIYELQVSHYFIGADSRQHASVESYYFKYTYDHNFD